MGKELPVPEKTTSFIRREEHHPNTGVDSADNPQPPEPIPEDEDGLEPSDDKNDDVKDKEDHDHQEDENKEKNDVGEDHQETKNDDEEKEENKNSNDEETAPADAADQVVVDEEEDPLITLHKVNEEIDRFVSSSSSSSFHDGPDDPDENAVKTEVVPEFVGMFLDLVEDKAAKHDSIEGRVKWNQLPENGSLFLQTVDRLSKLNKTLCHMKLEEETRSSLINRVGSIQQRAMAYLEEEFRSLMEESKTDHHHHDSDPSGGDNNNNSKDRCQLSASESETTGGDEEEDDNFPGYSNDVVLNLNGIAKEMISGGYESECLEVYMNARRIAFEESLHRLGFEKHSIDDVHKMHWEHLEREISSWITTFKHCATVHFSSERKLAEAVFVDFPSISALIFSNLFKLVFVDLLSFAEGVSMSKRSTEKLFKTLDMYETLRDMGPKMYELFPEECANELKKETTSTRCRVGEAAIFLFCDLENSIKSDTGKTPVPGGAVHPLSRYTMNYLKYTCEYKGTLEQVFREHSKIERHDSTSRPHNYEGGETTNQNNDGDEKQSPFSAQLLRVMDLLDSNLEAKSKLYKDVALSSIFMMNNGRYILQKIKGSAEIHELMGDTWCRKRSSELRQYHKNYQRETWSKLLQCLNHEGLNVNGKVVKPVLKERFKSFNALFEEIHKTQSTWIVSDEQLQSELRVSISAVVIPAYRSFLGRFSQYLDPGRQTEKYIKFQSEDIETYIDDLFDGNPGMSMARRKQ